MGGARRALLRAAAGGGHAPARRGRSARGAHAAAALALWRRGDLALGGPGRRGLGVLPGPVGGRGAGAAAYRGRARAHGRRAVPGRAHRHPALAPARMDLSLFFAGTAGSVPTPRRGLPALLLRAGGERILLDCGEGTQHQLLRSTVGLPDVDPIFISHLPLEHWLGLPGMIKTFEMRDRDRRLDVFGPPGLAALFSQVLRPIIGRTKYPLDVIELEHHEEVRWDDFVIA